MLYIVGLLNHLKRIQSCMAELEGDAYLNAKDLVLQVRARGKVCHLQPQFTFVKEGRIRYTAYFEQHVSGFAGWRPYFMKRWPAATEKLLFKRFALEHGLPTPPFWTSACTEVRDVLIKQNRSSFGVGIRGPFRDLQSPDAALRPEHDEYYEAFIPGRVAKAWYWNGGLVCLEVRPMPCLVGDGCSSVAELAATRSRRPVDATALAWLAAFQGRTPAAVLREGESMLADFKYGTPFDPPCVENENVLASFAGSRIEAELRRAGMTSAQAIPKSLRANTLFTLDAVVDDEDRVWFLEMNSNPMVHPDTYAAILGSLFEVNIEASS